MVALFLVFVNSVCVCVCVCVCAWVCECVCVPCVCVVSVLLTVLIGVIGKYKICDCGISR